MVQRLRTTVRCPGFVAQEQLVYLPDARRYEAGSASLIGLAGLEAAMELLLEVGVENIAAELLRKRALLLPALQEMGWNAGRKPTRPRPTPALSLVFTSPKASTWPPGIAN